MVIVWQAIEMSYSITAATIAVLKRFTESLNTGFGHGELIRVHANSQTYNMSDRTASLKQSKTSKPSISVEPIPNHTNRQDLPTAIQEGSNSQQLKLRPETLQHETTVSAPQRSPSMEDGTTESAGMEDNIIRHDVQYSVHYEEEPLVVTKHWQQ
jgi:hypothetical protein